jgi:hypothetical protein
MAEQNAPNITVQDFDAVIKIIDVCCTRGAIRGEEMAAVSTVREKFAAVVRDFVEKQQAAQAEQTVPVADTQETMALDMPAEPVKAE